jgi:opacity protein-like surface antigen
MRAKTSSLALWAVVWLLAGVPAAAQYGPPPPPPPMVPPAALTQRPHFYIGIEGTGFLIFKQVTDQAGYMGQGGGGNLLVGYRVAPYLSIEGNLGVNYHDEALGTYGGLSYRALDALYLMTVTADAKLHLGRGWPLQPFVQAGVGYAYLGATYGALYCGNFSCDTTFAQGPTFQLGGGFDYWLTPHIVFGGRLLYRAVYFKEAAYGDVTVRTNSGNFINGVNLGVSVSYHF